MLAKIQTFYIRKNTSANLLFGV